MKRAACLLAAGLCVCLAAAGCGTSSSERSSSAPPVDRPAPKPAAPNATADRGDPLEILSVLSVEHEVDVLSQRDGVVIETSKDEGSRVAAGDVLARLDDRALAAQRDRARADLDVARYNVQYNEAEVKARQSALRRQQELRKAGLSSEADLEEAEFKANGAKYDLQSWRSVVERNQAAVRELDVELEQTRIRAPFSGMVSRRYLRAGQTVTKDEKCFRVSQLAPLLVRFQVPETSPRHPHAGDVVRVALASDGRAFSARVLRVGPTVDPATGSYDVSAQLTGPDIKDLRPGMAVRVLWHTAAAPAK